MKDSAGQKLAYVYFEDEPGRRSAAKLLSKDEARRTVSRATVSAGGIGSLKCYGTGGIEKALNVSASCLSSFNV